MKRGSDVAPRKPKRQRLSKSSCSSFTDHDNVSTPTTDKTVVSSVDKICVLPAYTNVETATDQNQPQFGHTFLNDDCSFLSADKNGKIPSSATNGDISLSVKTNSKVNPAVSEKVWSQK